MPKLISTTDVRQGGTPHVMSYLLSVGLGLGILVLALAWYLVRG